MDSDEEFFSASSGDEQDFPKKEVTKPSTPPPQPKSVEKPKDEPKKIAEPVKKETVEPVLIEENVKVEIRKGSSDESEASITINESEKESQSSEDFVVADIPQPITSSESGDSKSSSSRSAEKEGSNSADDDAEATADGWEDWDSEAPEKEAKDEKKEAKNGSQRQESTEEEDTNWDWGTEGWKEEKPSEPVKEEKKGPLRLGKPAAASDPIGWGGFANVIGKSFSSAVESTFGLPSAEEFAQQASIADERAEAEELAEKEKPPRSAFEALAEGPKPAPVPAFGLFSGLVAGGLDALEAIGKKTFETLTVKDKAGRSRLFFDQSSEEPLSDLLKRIKDEQARSQQQIRAVADRPLDFFTAIGETTAMQNIEALELLTGASGIPTNSKSVNVLLEQIIPKSMPTAVDFTREFRRFLKNICSLDPSPVLKMHERASKTLAEAKDLEPKEAYTKSLSALVTITEAFVQLLAKVTQLRYSAGDKVPTDGFIQFCSVLKGALAEFENVSSELPAGQYFGEDVATRYMVDCQSAQELLERIFRLSVTVLCA
ncbi:unnamed protein product, partial [Mesorhabditis spiculigera]